MNAGELELWILQLLKFAGIHHYIVSNYDNNERIGYVFIYPEYCTKIIKALGDSSLYISCHRNR